MFSSLSAKYKFEVGRLGHYNMWWLLLSLIVNRYYDILSIELFLLGKLRILLTINKYPGMCCTQVSTSSECGLLVAIFFFKQNSFQFFLLTLAIGFCESFQFLIVWQIMIRRNMIHELFNFTNIQFRPVRDDDVNGGSLQWV